ncbi:MAG: ABC transporter substrate-binding protein [Lactovum sp.]
MKKIYLLLMLGLMSFSLFACNTAEKKEESQKDIVTFQALNGEVEVPKNPKRVVVQNYPDELQALGVEVFGTDSWSMANPYLKEEVPDLGTPSLNIERLLEINPDLIITVDQEQLADYEKIAPTVLVNYQDFSNMNDSLDFFADLLNKEEEKELFLSEFNKEAEKQRERLKERGISPENLTISLIELSADKIYAYGSNFARGGQSLTTGLGFKESKAMKKLSEGIGYAELNAENLDEFDADYIFVDYKAADSEQFKTLSSNPVWKKMKAVVSGQVISIDYDKVYFYGGPLASQAQMDLYVDSLLEQLN